VISSRQKCFLEEAIVLKQSIISAALVISSGSLSQHEVLLGTPPVYQVGEGAEGVLIGVDGTQLVLQQRAERAEDKLVYLFVSAVDETGAVRAKFRMDPRTGSSHFVSETEKALTVSSNCSASRLYPITLGKVYECETSFDVNGSLISTRMRIEFTVRDRNSRGRLERFCGTIHEEDPSTIVRGAFCSSGDGKWIRSKHIFEVRPLSKT
jgi:hypothetical protein